MAPTFKLFVDGVEQETTSPSLSSGGMMDASGNDGESSASYSPDLEQLEFDIEEGISVDCFNELDP